MQHKINHNTLVDSVYQQKTTLHLIQGGEN